MKLCLICLNKIKKIYYLSGLLWNLSSEKSMMNYIKVNSFLYCILLRRCCSWIKLLTSQVRTKLFNRFICNLYLNIIYRKPKEMLLSVLSAAKVSIPTTTLTNYGTWIHVIMWSAKSVLIRKLMLNSFWIMDASNAQKRIAKMLSLLKISLLLSKFYANFKF